MRERFVGLSIVSQCNLGMDGDRWGSARKVVREAYLDRQDLGAVHFPDDSTTEEGHSSASAARHHLLKANSQHENRTSAANALHIGERQLLQAVLARLLCNAGLLCLAHLQVKGQNYCFDANRKDEPAGLTQCVCVSWRGVIVISMTCRTAGSSES